MFLKTFIYPGKAELAPFTFFPTTLCFTFEMLESTFGALRLELKRKLDPVPVGGKTDR